MQFKLELINKRGVALHNDWGFEL